MTQRPHFSQKSKNCKKNVSRPLTDSLSSDISAAAYAWEQFKPSKDLWSLVVQTENKTFQIWVWGFRWMSSGLGYVLFFVFFFHDVIAQRMRPFNGSKFVWILAVTRVFRALDRLPSVSSAWTALGHILAASYVHI